MKQLKYLLVVLTILMLSGLAANAMSAPVCHSPIPDSGYLRNFQNLQTGVDGWLFREHDLIDSFGPSQKGYNGLRALQAALRERGTNLVIVPLPTRAIVHPEKLGDVEFSHRTAAKNYFLYLNRLRRVGLLVPELDKLTQGDQENDLFFARDHHWRPAGAQATAELVAELIASENLLGEYSPTTFTTSVVAQDATAGSYSRAATQLCEIEYEEEQFDVFYSAAELDLFDEPAAPEVVLVGTSNSNGSKDFNFSGFLRQELRADVLNMATSGGGYDESLLQYLASPEYQAHRPKIIVWEVPGYYSLNLTSFYEELLSLLEEKS